MARRKACGAESRRMPVNEGAGDRDGGRGTARVGGEERYGLEPGAGLWM